MGQLQQLVAAGGGPSQLASMGSQQAQLISSQAQQGGQQHATLVSDKKEDEEGVAEAERCTHRRWHRGQPTGAGGDRPLIGHRVASRSVP